MQYQEPIADCGVIIGRFQVPELHDGHRDLLVKVFERHRKVIVLLGVAPLPNSINNPLDFESRKQMLMGEFPKLTVLYVRDMNSDVLWSQQVDRVISDVLTPTQTALLYGSRDSFISHYTGRFNTYELPAHHPVSGTSLREEIGREAYNSKEWRAGVIWASRNRFPVSYQCVDVAIFDDRFENMLLGHKIGEPGWRLIGGFTDPASLSLEADARREVREETGLELDLLRYVRSFQIDDWRYRNEPDCIKTALFVGRSVGEPEADDDIDSVQWFPLADVDPASQHLVLPNHRRLVTAALNFRTAHLLERTSA